MALVGSAYASTIPGRQTSGMAAAMKGFRSWRGMNPPTDQAASPGTALKDEPTECPSMAE
jgi:hypothetical protein